MHVFACSIRSFWHTVSCSSSGQRSTNDHKEAGVSGMCFTQVSYCMMQCWTLYKRHLVGRQQWKLHISLGSTHQIWNDPETITEKLIKHRLEWLGDSTGMEDYR